jgi:sec-independent protein translocase protein TatA
MNTQVLPLAFGLGTPEIVLILVVIVLLFGASKLPELARGSGRALRIFKAETKGLMDDDEASELEEKKPTVEPRSEGTPEQTRKNDEA